MEKLNIKDLILEAPEKEEEEAPAAVEKKKPSVTYEVQEEGCDLIVRRKTLKTSRLMVLLLSQSQFYIKNEKNGSVEELTVKNMTDFMKDLQEPIELKSLNWLHILNKGKHFCEDVVKSLENEKNVLAAREGRWHFKCNRIDGISWWALKYLADFYGEEIRDAEFYASVEGFWYRGDTKLIPGGYPPSRSGEIVSEYKTVFKMFEDILGTDNARKLIMEYAKTGFERAPTASPDIDETITFGNIGRFIQYAVYDIMREGFLLNPNSFWREWFDDLRMQFLLYGKVEEKYPKHLASHHMYLSYLMQIHKQEIDKKRWEIEKGKAKELNAEYGEYFIRCPETLDEVDDEARQQGNCVASYKNAMVEGRSRIFFLRKRETPEASLATIEVRGKNITQALSYRNSHVGTAEYNVIMKWAEEKGLEARFGYYGY